jgi:hypothetical protein
MWIVDKNNRPNYVWWDWAQLGQRSPDYIEIAPTHILVD